MRLPLAILAFALLPAGLASAQGVVARERIVSERVIVERHEGTPVVVQRRANICIPWCSADLNPCDPPEFKAADGRCAIDNR
jgi:hypothetical protein